MGTCYLMLPSNTASSIIITVSAVPTTYPITIEGYLTTIIISPTFTLQQ